MDVLYAVIPLEWRMQRFVSSGLYDFGRLLEVQLEGRDGPYGFMMSRAEAQKLFDEMWRAYFRPTENP